MPKKSSRELVLNKSVAVGLFVVMIFSIFFENTLIIYKELDKKSIVHTKNKIDKIFNRNKKKEIYGVRDYMHSCIEDSIYPTSLPSLAGYKGMTNADYDKFANTIIYYCKSKYINDAENNNVKKKRKVLWKHLK
jgi:hypothetical protein